jgi:cytochrome P450
MTAISALLVPPRPAPAQAPLSALELGLRLGRNILSIWTEDAYRQDLLVGPFFGVKSFTLNGPDEIRHVFVDNHEAYGRSQVTRRMLRPILGDGLFLAEGQEWRRQRRALAPAFVPRSIDPLRGILTAVARDKLDQLTPRVGRPINLFAFTQRLALDVAGRTMFSLEMASRAEEMRSNVEAYAEAIGPSLFDLILPDSWPSPRDLRRNRVARRWRRFIEGLIDQRRTQGAAPETPRDLFDLLTSAPNPNDSGEERAYLRDQVATMILAGHETTAIGLFWSLLLLALDPAAQDRAAAEASAWPGDNGAAIPTQLPYLHAVASETLRLYPPAFLITRVALKEDRIGERRVAPGDVVSVSPWLLHRSARRWRDPHAFDPSRFFSDAPAIDRFAYLPFGIGPRVCIGAHFAMTELVLVLAEALKRFRFERTDSAPVLPVAVVTLRPDHTARFRLSSR